MKQNRNTTVQDMGSSPHSGKPLVMGSTVFNEDCMTVMVRYPDKYFDLAVVDPPYGIGMSDYNRNGNMKFDMNKKWDDYTPAKEYWQELFRVSKNQIVWGGNYFTEYLPASKGWIFWDKKQQGNLQVGELAWTSFDRMKYYLRSWQLDRNWQVPGGKIHPTQKPIPLYDWVFSEFAKEGYLILDTHLGSGSSRIAAHKHNLEFVGCEIDAEYFASQEARFKEFTSQLRLFGQQYCP